MYGKLSRRAAEDNQKIIRKLRRKLQMQRRPQDKVKPQVLSAPKTTAQRLAVRADAHVESERLRLRVAVENLIFSLLAVLISCYQSLIVSAARRVDVAATPLCIFALIDISAIPRRPGAPSAALPH